MAKRFRAVKPELKLDQAIVDQVEEMILNGDLRPGDQLPSERDLAAAFGVARPTVREATKVLESRGLLEVRRGSGVFVTSAIDLALLDSLDLLVRYNQCTPEMIYEVRWVIEVAMAGLAAERATETDLTALQSAVDDMAANLEDVPGYNKADLAFHRAVAESTHNQMFATLADFLLRGIASVIELVTKTRGNTSRGLREHQRVYAAIAARDPHAAREAMQNHLIGSQEELYRMTGHVRADTGQGGPSGSGAE
jgi:DNA-binding FadR family transcriptional regulator